MIVVQLILILKLLRMIVDVLLEVLILLISIVYLLTVVSQHVIRLVVDIYWMGLLWIEVLLTLVLVLIVLEEVGWILIILLEALAIVKLRYILLVIRLIE